MRWYLTRRMRFPDAHGILPSARGSRVVIAGRWLNSGLGYTICRYTVRTGLSGSLRGLRMTRMWWWLCRAMRTREKYRYDAHPEANWSCTCGMFHTLGLRIRLALPGNHFGLMSALRVVGMMSSLRWWATLVLAGVLPVMSRQASPV